MAEVSINNVRLQMTALIPMLKINSSTGQEKPIDEAELAAAAFLAR